MRRGDSHSCLRASASSAPPRDAFGSSLFLAPVSGERFTPRRVTELQWPSLRLVEHGHIFGGSLTAGTLQAR